jgi:hypothetical protein
MNEYMNTMLEMATRLDEGEAEAATALRSALQPHLVRIVRQTLRRGVGASKFSRQILDRADALGGSERHATDPQWLEETVAADLCVSMIGGLRAESRRSRGLLDTVCD